MLLPGADHGTRDRDVGFEKVVGRPRVAPGRGDPGLVFMAGGMGQSEVRLLRWADAPTRPVGGKSRRKRRGVGEGRALPARGELRDVTGVGDHEKSGAQDRGAVPWEERTAGAVVLGCRCRCPCMAWWR